MKKILFLSLLSMLIALFLILGNGCTAKKRKDSSIDDRQGVLQDNGQGVCLNVDTGRMWQIKRGGKFSSFQEAKQYAENLKLGGYDDWRLPTKQELFSLHFIVYWKKNGNCKLKYPGEYFILDEDEVSLGHWQTYILCEPNFKYVQSLGTKGFVRAVRP